RENAKKSTGPRSAKGKAVARLNAVTHGIFARYAVLTGPPLMENPAEFFSLLESLRTHFNPVGILEDTIVQQIAGGIWNAGRLARYLAAGTTERLYAAISGITRKKEELAWTDMHLGKPPLRLANHVDSGQVVSGEMLRNQTDLVEAALNADGKQIDENEDFM